MKAKRNFTRWTAERVARLRAMWADDMGPIEIAAVLGVTPNAVSNKAWALGLNGNRPRVRSESQKKAAARPGAREHRAEIARRTYSRAEVREAHQAAMQRPDERAKRAAAQKLAWQKPGVRETRVRSHKRGRAKRALLAAGAPLLKASVDRIVELRERGGHSYETAVDAFLCDKREARA